jgi:NitT/TauT family transport system ATP-binding protein
MNAPIISIKNLNKHFPRQEGRRHTEVFHDVNLTVHSGEFLVILGPSGCGKSTFLRILAGLDKQTSGTVEYSQHFSLDKVSFVFQNFGILPWLTIHKNVELNLIAKNIPEHERAKEVRDILEIFGLSAFKDSLPHELSGGMRQRVGLARAFVSKPEIIFLDEPFSELDFITAESLRGILLALWQERGTTVVMVSHYIDEAVSLADHIAIFSDRPGNIKTMIKNDLPRPRDPRSPTFFALEDEVVKHFDIRK